MPFKDATAKRIYQREYMRKRRARTVGTSPPPEPPDDPVTALASWAESTLIVPPGHPLAGDPMIIPDFAIDFLRDSWYAHESALCTGRKNAKSAICAVLALGFLVGPMRSPGWRGAICSVSKEKAAELRGQVQQIIDASRELWGHVTIRRSPYPGVIESESGRLDTLSADRTAGHASGYDLVFVDETGLMPERARDLLAGLRSSVSARNGRIIHISIRGDSPLYREILQNPANVVHVHEAPEGCALDDRAAWAAANPGLGTIKQLSYMSKEVERIRGAPGDEPSFRAYDLNQPLNPQAEMVCAPDDLRQCFTDAPPPRRGPCFLGFDFGEATSGTAAAAIWPETARMETWLAFGDVPDLKERGRRDDANYLEMEARGELRTYPGRVVKVDTFLSDIAADLAGVHVQRAAADSYKDSEVRDFMDRSKLKWEIDLRRVGAGKDGSRDVRALQRLITQRMLRLKDNLSLATSISKSTLRRDGNGNPGIERANSRGRIDVLSAAVIACGLAEPHFDRRPRRTYRFLGRVA